MANDDSAGVDNEVAVKEAFNHFQWHHDQVDKVALPGRGAMAFAGKVRDISGGVAAILEILEHDSIADDCGGASKLFHDGTRGQLARMAITASEMLNGEAEQFMQWAYEWHTKDGIAERKASASL